MPATAAPPDSDASPSPSLLVQDLSAGMVLFFVALPLNLGIALASGTPLVSGLIAGIVGAIVVGLLSGSQTSVSGPAAGLTAVVASLIVSVGSFETFLLVVVLAGVMQAMLGLIRAGEYFAFVPSSVIQGLLAAIGVILILKQLPHVFGHDADPLGEMSFFQPDQQNTFSELAVTFAGDMHLGAAVVGLLSIALLVLWARWKPLKQSSVPGPLVVVLLGVALYLLFNRVGGSWRIGDSHLVQIPVAQNAQQLFSYLTFPDFSRGLEWKVWEAAGTLGIVASLQSLLNLEAVDRLDPQQRDSPHNRELVAQGVGNVVTGLIGGLPVTSVIGRGMVNIQAGAQTCRSTIFHGALLLIAVALLPTYLNKIPLAALAAVLVVTGFSLASPRLFRRMWREGMQQFIPFMVTLLAIVFSDLLVGILVGLATSAVFILHNNLRSPIRRVLETHQGGEVLHIELANNVSFLNRAALARILKNAPRGGHLLIDATETEYIDPDVLSMIREFKATKGPAREVTVSLRGFQPRYKLRDEILFADYASRELRDELTPRQVLDIFLEGNQRFRDGKRLTRDFGRQVDATSKGQTPLAVVLSCIDSRVPVELVFDLGIGDIFSVRVAGNVLGENTLGSIEYAAIVSEVKLVLVMGHTRCGAVTASVELLCADQDPAAATGCGHLNSIVDEIGQSLDRQECSTGDQEALIQEVTRRNVLRTVDQITRQSDAIRAAVAAGRVMVVGALYDVSSAKVTILANQSRKPTLQ